MPPRAPRASLLPDPRAFLLVVCVLVLCAALCLPAPASGSSLLLGSSGFVLSRPLLLQGADVGAVLSALQADVAELKLQNAQLQGDLAVAKQQITELQESVVELQDTVTTQGGRLSQAETGIGELEAARNVMNGTLAEHGTRLVIAESNVAGLDAWLATAESNLTVLDTRLAAAETLDLPTTPLTETLAQVRDLTSGTLLFTAVSGLQTTVSSQGTRLNVAEGGLADLTTRVAAAEDLTGNSTLATTLTALRDKTGSSALVMSLPCYGTTNTSAWQVYATTSLVIEVSTAACGFSTKPQHVSASLFGSTGHWATMGASSVYSVTETSFKVFILPTKVSNGTIVNYPRTPEQATTQGWRINWMAAR